jgi:lysophospholipase L1-like esterase
MVSARASGGGMADPSGPEAPRTAHGRGDLLSLVLFLAGIAAMFQWERGGQPPTAAFDLRAWRAAAADGTVLRAVPGRPAGLSLPAGGRFWLIEDDDDLNRYDEVAFDLKPASDASRIELRLRWTKGSGFLLRSALPPDASTALWHLGGETGPQRFASQPAGKSPAPADGDVHRVAVRFDDEAFTVSVDGAVVVEHESRDMSGGSIELMAVDDGVDVLGLRLSGRKSTQGGAAAPFEVDDAMRAEAPRSRQLAALGVGTAKLLTLWLAGVLFLRALSPSPRGVIATLAAGLRLTAPGCAALLAGVLLHLPETPTLAAFVAPIGMLPAWRRLLAPAGTAADAPAAAPRRAALVAILTILIVCGGTGWMIGQREHTLLGQLSVREVAARRAPPPTTFSSSAPLTLDADNALVIPGSWTDARLAAHLSLEPGAVLALRLRAPRPTVAEGVLVVLPADPALESRMYHEDPMHLWDLCEPGPPLPAGRDLQLELLMRGRRFEASVDGRPLFGAVSLEPVEGQLVLLSHRGRVDLRSVRVEPLDHTAPASPLVAAATSALLPTGALIVFALLASLLLRFDILQAWHAGAFALLPLSGLLLLLPAEATPTDKQLQAAALAGGAALAIVPLTRCSTRPLAALLLAAISGTALVPTLTASLHPSAEVTSDLMSRASYQTWPGDRLHESLLHVEHPLFRRWNHYLALHTFRDRPARLEKSADTVRVVALGGSSTWGWRIPPETRGAYPAVLEARLSGHGGGAADGGPTRFEVINAAYPAATSGRLFRMLRNVLVGFEPDIVVLSVFYNDTLALSQGDEDAYLERVSAPDARRGWLDDWLEQRARARERMTSAGFMRAALRSDDAAEIWRTSGAEGWPPDRFAASLRRYAELAQERGFDLVFVKEPIAGDGAFVWKQEFYAVMDAVGAEYGIPVADPTPALQAAGGTALFMDAVHLKPGGHRVVAEALEPVVRALAARRAERARLPPASGGR